MSFNFRWVYLVLAALPAFGADPAQPVALYTSFQQLVPDVVVESVQAELETIMGPLGMQFEWRSLSSVRGNEVSAELAVIAFKGRCDAAGLTTHPGRPGALGWTHVSDGVILPFSDIDCDGIRQFVQRDLLFVRAGDRAAAFGRAVGRVLAHELYHIFSQTAHHGSDGVAKSAFTVQELLADEFQFEERDTLALRTAAAHPTEKSGTGTP